MASNNYLKEIKQYNVRQASPSSGKTALIVVDMQRYFEGVAAPILENVVALLHACRAAGVRVVFTRHGHRDPMKDGGMLTRWWSDLIVHGTLEWALMEDLSPNPDEPIIDKIRYSAFHGTNLDEWLRRIGIEDLIITGVLTNCCCETTARDAFVRDYRVFFVADGTATVNEELHVASLKNLAFGFAHVVDAKSLCAWTKSISSRPGEHA
ncbi:MAG: isochorismatase family protein [Deltaproteobacteria bacterium]|nr:isochorismatase family protein [Deltaproteobacteria bacterium]